MAFWSGVCVRRVLPVAVLIAAGSGVWAGEPPVTLPAAATQAPMTVPQPMTQSLMMNGPIAPIAPMVAAPNHLIAPSAGSGPAVGCADPSQRCNPLRLSIRSLPPMYSAPRYTPYAAPRYTPMMAPGTPVGNAPGQ